MAGEPSLRRCHRPPSISSLETGLDRNAEPLLHRGGDRNQATVWHVEGFGRGVGQIEHTTFNKRPAVVHDNRHAAMSFPVGDAQARSEWQSAVRGCEFIAVVAFAGSGAALVVLVVERGDAGEMS